jgi:hypothetical protein
MGNYLLTRPQGTEYLPPTPDLEAESRRTAAPAVPYSVG